MVANEQTKQSNSANQVQQQQLQVSSFLEVDRSSKFQPKTVNFHYVTQRVCNTFNLVCLVEYSPPLKFFLSSYANIQIDQSVKT